MPEPLTITEADVGRIVYAHTHLGSDIDALTPEMLANYDTSSVVVMDNGEDGFELGCVRLRYEWTEEDRVSGPSVEVIPVSNQFCRWYATQAEAFAADITEMRLRAARNVAMADKAESLLLELGLMDVEAHGG